MNALNGFRNRPGAAGAGGRRSGFVLVSVLLLCVMLVSSATAYAWFVKLQIRTLTQEKFSLQARGAALTLAKGVMRGLKLDTNNFDSVTEPWFQPMAVPLEGLGTANVLLTPLDNKLPLQHLFLPDKVTLRNEVKDVWDMMWDRIGEKDISEKVLDFLDEDTNPRLGGTDGPENLNRALLDISELLGVKEITPAILYGRSQNEQAGEQAELDENTPEYGLADYCTMWGGDKININTAEPQVLAIINGLNENLAEEIVKFRQKKEIVSLSDLNEISAFPSRAVPAMMNLVAFKSVYFNLQIELVNEDASSSKNFEIVLNRDTGQILRWEEI